MYITLKVFFSVDQLCHRRVPVHRYILASRSEFFCQKFDAETKPHEVRLDEIDEAILSELLSFIYTDSCRLLTPGCQFEWQDKKVAETSEHEKSALAVDSNMSAYEVCNKQQDGRCKSKEKTQKHNPVHKLQEMAKKFGIKHLVKRYVSML